MKALLLKGWAWALWLLGFEIASLHAAFRAKKMEYVGEMRKTHDEAAALNAREVFRSFASFHTERITFHTSQELVEKALLYQLTAPPRPQAGGSNEFWTQSRLGAVLTERGFEDLRPRVRAEEKERREVRLSLAVWIGALTGLVGALTGLVAVLKG